MELSYAREGKAYALLGYLDAVLGRSNRLQYESIDISKTCRENYLEGFNEGVKKLSGRDCCCLDCGASEVMVTYE